MKKIWNLKAPSPHAATLSESSGLSRLEAQILTHRGILDPRHVASFLHPRLANLLDPYLLKDMQAAIDLIVSAIDRRDPITIYGDGSQTRSFCYCDDLIAGMMPKAKIVLLWTSTYAFY